MTKTKYPRVWVVFATLFGGRQYPRQVYADRVSAEMALHETALTRPSVVELIPLPEHEAIVAAAVAAERERCAGIAKRVADETGGPNRSYLDHFEQERIDTADMIERKIREVPT